MKLQPFTFDDWLNNRVPIPEGWSLELTIQMAAMNPKVLTPEDHEKILKCQQDAHDAATAQYFEQLKTSFLYRCKNAPDRHKPGEIKRIERIFEGHEDLIQNIEFGYQDTGGIKGTTYTKISQQQYVTARDIPESATYPFCAEVQYLQWLKPSPGRKIKEVMKVEDLFKPSIRRDELKGLLYPAYVDKQGVWNTNGAKNEITALYQYLENSEVFTDNEDRTARIKCLYLFLGKTVDEKSGPGVYTTVKNSTREVSNPELEANFDRLLKAWISKQKVKH